MVRMQGRLGAAAVAGCLAVWMPAGVPAQTTAPAAPPPAPAAAVTDVDTSLRLGTADERMTVPVSIGGRGPWPFVIDTGAERSVVSNELAGRLGLAAGPAIRVLAMAGPKVVPSALVPSLAVTPPGTPRPLPPASVVAPALAARDIGAAGLLGIDTLQGHRVVIDFEHATMSLQPSRKRQVSPGQRGDEIVVVARSLFGQLIVTDAQWRGRRLAVVIDTGSSMTIGNPALQRLMQARAHRVGSVIAYSVTGDALAAEAYTVGDLTLGGVHINQLPVAFADAAPFRRFGLEWRPAVMLGMDALRLFRRVRIDFPNRAIEFRLPREVMDRQ